MSSLEVALHLRPRDNLSVTSRRAPMPPLIIALATLVTNAHAERHVVQRGETIAHVARVHGCTTASLLRANHLQTTLVPPGTVIKVPRCAPALRARKTSTIASPQSPAGPSAKARQALAVIDAPSAISRRQDLKVARVSAETDDRERSIDGATWIADSSARRGERLKDGRRLQAGQGYEIRRPARAYGAGHVVDHIRHAIAEVRALYPNVHTLAIGDLSAQHGGKIADHISHRTGLDVDIGFYFRRMPTGYPAQFSAADSTLDVQATWALLTAFARTAPLPTGVAMIFLDYDIQRRLYHWARQRGTSERDLSFLFQYPRNADAPIGLVRHWPQHGNHLHVRFKPGG